MPTFDTPEPISVAIEVVAGDIRITASERADTAVQVRPSDGSHEEDVRAAEQTRVEYAAGRLLVTAPKQRGLGLFSKAGLIDVTIGLPAGSHVRGDAAIANVRCMGDLGECRVKTATGDIEVDRAGALELSTAGGAIAVDRAGGDAEVSAGSGRIRLREIDGTAVIKNANGDIWVGEISGDLRVRTANGDISVDHAHASVTATTANGHIRVSDIVRGSASLKTGFGEIDVGIHAGTAARLDVYTRFGTVHNSLDAAQGPGEASETADVRARTGYGDIVVRRS